MATLSKEIENALAEGNGLQTHQDRGNLPKIAKGIAKAVEKWLTKQTFTITEFEGGVGIEELRITKPINVNVAIDPSAFLAAHPGGPLKPNPLVYARNQGVKSAVIPPKTWKSPVDIVAWGKATLGDVPHRKGSAKANADGKWNQVAKVKLDPNNTREV
jgi:hypothetical protein